MEILTTLQLIVVSLFVVGVTSSEWNWSPAVRPSGWRRPPPTHPPPHRVGWSFKTTPKPRPPPPHRPHGGWVIKKQPPAHPPPSAWTWAVAVPKPTEKPPPPTHVKIIVVEKHVTEGPHLTPPPPPGGWGWTPSTTTTTTTPAPPTGGWGWSPPTTTTTTTTPPPPTGGWGWSPPTAPPPPPPPEIPKPTEPSVIWANYIECKAHSKSPSDECSSRWVRLQ